MQKLFSLLLFSLSAICATAQVDFGEFQFEKGYVVTNKGDTLRGKIKYARAYELSQRCTFIKDGDETNEHIRYQPFTIKTFCVKNEIYESKIYDYSPDRPDGFGVFMHRIENGECKMYEYWNSDKERGFTQVFLEKKGKMMEEVGFFMFKKQMMSYFSDYPQLQAKIGRNAFKRSEVQRIVQEYNSFKARKV